MVTDPPIDALIVRRLKDGDEAAFASVMDSWSPLMLRLARLHVATPQSAEDIVQETWLAVLRGLQGFEERCSLRTWVFRILMNKAKSWGMREHRTVPTATWDGEAAGPTVAPSRFRGSDDQLPDHWRMFPLRWPATPEGELLAGEVRRLLAAELERLPPRQRTVIELRDVHGYTADEVCRILGLTHANQRVLLHRARARVRVGIEEYFGALNGGKRWTAATS